jgi:hypothetical protein
VRELEEENAHLHKTNTTYQQKYERLYEKAQKYKEILKQMKEQGLMESMETRVVQQGATTTEVESAPAIQPTIDEMLGM